MIAFLGFVLATLGFLIVFIGVPIGLVRPPLVLRWIKDPSRWQVLKYGLPIGILMVWMGGQILSSRPEFIQEKIEQGEQFMTLAQREWDAGNYEAAKVAARKARSAFISGSDHHRRASAFMDSAEVAIERETIEAERRQGVGEQFMTLAQREWDAGNYEAAKVAYRKARSAFISGSDHDRRALAFIDSAVVAIEAERAEEKRIEAERAEKERIEAEQAERKRIEAERKQREAEERRLALAAEREKQCRNDLRCWGEKHLAFAEVYCKEPIERLAKWDFEWTDGFLEDKFDSYGWKSRKDGTLRYSGDKIKFQNGFGAWQHMRYSCDFNPASKAARAQVKPR